MKVVFPTLLLAFVLADVRGCACDVSKPETMEARACSLCREAELQPAEPFVFFLKDANPTKPNRWLALPRKHYPGPHSMAEMSAEERTELWTAAIEKAITLWGDSWGLAVNGDQSRTQCHAHIHIGKLNDDVETVEGLIVVTTPSEIPLPADGTGLWVHPVDGKLHVHTGAQINEKVLMR